MDKVKESQGSVVLRLMNRKAVTEQMWGSAAHRQTQAYSKHKGLWGRKNVFMRVLHNLGEQETSQFQALLSHKTQKNPICSPKD